MGRYLNQSNMTKESWLATNAIQCDSEGAPDNNTCTIEGEPYTLAILVDNGPFTACALAYSREEMLAFLHPDDERPKKYFWIPNTLTYCFVG